MERSGKTWEVVLLIIGLVYGGYIVGFKTGRGAAYDNGAMVRDARNATSMYQELFFACIDSLARVAK